MEITREYEGIKNIIEGLAKLVLEVVSSDAKEDNSYGKNN